MLEVKYSKADLIALAVSTERRPVDRLVALRMLNQLFDGGEEVLTDADIMALALIFEDSSLRLWHTSDEFKVVPPNSSPEILPCGPATFFEVELPRTAHSWEVVKLLYRSGLPAARDWVLKLACYYDKCVNGCLTLEDYMDGALMKMIVATCHELSYADAIYLSAVRFPNGSDRFAAVRGLVLLGEKQLEYSSLLYVLCFFLHPNHLDQREAGELFIESHRRLLGLGVQSPPWANEAFRLAREFAQFSSLRSEIDANRRRRLMESATELLRQLFQKAPQVEQLAKLFLAS